MEIEKIVKPIFIVGSGRSGTTLIYKLFASHRELTWFSNWTTRLPIFPQLAFLSRLSGKINHPLLTNRKVWPIPDMEGIGIHKYCGFYSLPWEKKRALTEEDVTHNVARQFITIISKHQKYHGKKRFVHKNVMNSMRILYLKAIFPDAKFIHIVRDGRAVALSLSHVAFWKDLHLWWNDYTPTKWKSEGKDPLLLCGLHWQREVREIIEAAKYLPPEQYLCIRYEDFVEQPLFWLEEMTKFCELPWDPNLNKVVERKRIRNLNNRWESTVPLESQALVQNAIEDTLIEFNYLSKETNFVSFPTAYADY